MKQDTPAGNDLVHQINETREWKNREEDPQIHIKVNDNNSRFGSHFNIGKHFCYCLNFYDFQVASMDTASLPYMSHF